MASKWQVNNAVKLSELVPPRRLIMFVLADVADPATAVIPDERTPSLRELAQWTGLDKSTITRHLDALDEDGWVIRDRPDLGLARREHVRTRYRLAVPHGAHSTMPNAAEGTDQAAVVQPAPSSTAQNGHGMVHRAPSHGAQGTKGMVQSAPVPYPDQEGTIKNPSSSAKPPKAAKQPEPERLDVEKICRHLADRIEANGSLRPTITAKWRTEARLLLDRDGRTVEQVMRAIDWCQSDEFWRGNIRSMPTLRKQYDTLRLHAMRANGRASPQLVERNGLKLKPETAQRMDDRKRFEDMDKAMEARGTLAIGGPA